jgi:hypothetical protein
MSVAGLANRDWRNEVFSTANTLIRFYRSSRAVFFVHCFENNLDFFYNIRLQMEPLGSEWRRTCESNEGNSQKKRRHIAGCFSAKWWHFCQSRYILLVAN